MAKRIFDVIFSSVVLVLALPFFALIALAIRLTDRGPVFYRARRHGQGNSEFMLYKFRTMRVGADREGAITALADDRVSRLGHLLRATKLDELPQFWNVLIGEMAIVGPRPEDVSVVQRCYTDEQRRTLSVLPGIASPGSIFNYTHAAEYLRDGDVAGTYEKDLLPVKLGLELVYVDRQSFWYDLRIIGRTMAVIARSLCGRREFPLPFEHSIARSRGYFE